MDAVTALVILGLLTLVLIAVEVIAVYATQGFAYGFSANRAPAAHSGLRKRIENIYRNQVESVTYMAPVLGAAAILGVTDGIVPTLIAIMVGARIGFAVAYYTGLPFVRVPFFGMGTVATLILGVTLLGHIPAG